MCRLLYHSVIAGLCVGESSFVNLAVCFIYCDDPVEVEKSCLSHINVRGPRIISGMMQVERFPVSQIEEEGSG